jgi:uncharacterized protein
VATIRYLKNSRIIPTAILPAILTAVPSAFLGAYAVKGLDKEILKPIIIGLFSVVAIYTFINKDLGIRPPKDIPVDRKIFLSLLTGLVIGFYDGFFGPGTGSFLMFIYIVLFGFEFMQASAHAKLLNCFCNAAALSLFIWKKDVDYLVAVPVAVFNITGSVLGSRLAIRKGSGFIRVFFIVAVSGFILKMIFDLLFP